MNSQSEVICRSRVERDTKLAVKSTPEFCAPLSDAEGRPSCRRRPARRNRIGLERGDDLARMRDLRVGWRITTVNCGDLIGMNREAADETIASGAPTIPLEPLQIAKIRINRIDRRDFGGRRREQALRAGQLVRIRPRPIGFLVVGRAERGRRSPPPMSERSASDAPAHRSQGRTSPSRFRSRRSPT